MNMIRHSVVLILFLVVIAGGAVGQEHFIVKKDLQPDWLIYSAESYKDFSNSKDRVTTTIYFSLKPARYRGDYLVLTSDYHFSVMLNGRLFLDQRKSSTLLMDSLSNLFPNSELFFAIHQEQKINPASLTTYIRSKTWVNTTRENKIIIFKKETFFRDFVITAVLILLIFLISIIRLNPGLSSDYFSVTKIFSLRENEDDQFYYRLTSANILFYVFTSTVLAFYLIVIGQSVETELSGVRINGYLSSLLAWLKVSLIILTILFIKMLAIYLVASLFRVRDVAGFHFFNFIRLLLVFMGVLTLVLATDYLLHGQQKGFYSFLHETLSWILGGWAILLFLKLINRVPFSLFHLFSYICATEIIPFLLIVKVLNE